MTAAISPLRYDEMWPVEESGRPDRTDRADRTRVTEQDWRITPRRTAVVIGELRSADPAPPVRPSRRPVPRVPRPPATDRTLGRTIPGLPLQEVRVVEGEHLRRRRIAAIASLAVVGVAMVGVIGGLGQLLPGAGIAEGAVPERVTVERVGAGETLWDVAARVAPGSDPAAVVDRIRELNVIGGSAVTAGEALRVPDGR